MIGMRTLKTAIAVSLCFVLYNIFLPNSTHFGPFYSGIAAVMTIQPSLDASKEIGFTRIFGTIVGGIYSAIVFSLYTYIAIPELNFVFIFFGIILTIITCNKLNISAGIGTGCIVLIGAFGLDLTTGPLIHSMYRTIDTLTGVTIALVINKILPGPQLKDN